jgi:PTS system mannose-specific IIA component
VTHGSLGKAALEAVEIIAGKQDNVSAIGLYHGDDPEIFGNKILKSIQSLSYNSESILVIVDFYGGTPCNQVMRLLQNHNFKAIAGLNLPMLLELLVSDRNNTDLDKIVSESIEKGKNGIINLNQKFNQIIAKEVS